MDETTFRPIPRPEQLIAWKEMDEDHDSGILFFRGLLFGLGLVGAFVAVAWYLI